jgi:two-component system, cell cycle sensor histidine kinase and response regulator CckA
MISDHSRQSVTMIGCSAAVRSCFLSIFICFIFASPSAATSPDHPRRVLVIPSYNFNYLGSQWFLQGVMAEFAEHAPFKVTFFHENLQLAARSSDQQYQDNMAASLKIKYAMEKPDLVIVQYKQALLFMVRYGQEIFGSVPVVYSGLTAEGGYSQIELPENYTGITASFSAKKNIELILRNHPTAKKIYVVGGSSPVEQDLVNEAMKEGKAHNKNVEFIALSNFTFSDLLTRLNSIRDNSVILYQVLLVDAEGKVFVPAQAAIEIARAAHVPVYGMLDTYMGSGITGGFLVYHEGMGRRAAEIGMKILLGKGMPSIPLTSEIIGSYRFDWRQLKRWGIDENHLPIGNKIEFKEFRVWDSYKWEIIGGICLILMQALLIVGLLTNRFRRIKAEGVLRESEHKYRVLFETANDGIFLQDTTGFVDCNQKGASMYGLPTEDVIGHSPAELSPERQPDGRPSSEVAAERILAAFNGEPQSFQWQALRADGIPLDVEITLNRVEIGGSFLLQAIMRDITDRKRAEDALRESEERFKLSMEATNDGLWDWDIKTDGGYFSPTYYLMLGYEVGAFACEGKVWKDLIHPDDREHALLANMDCIEGRRECFEVEYRMKAKNGEWRWILGRGKCIARDEQGHALRMVGTHVDITDRKRAEEALRASEEKYRQVVENAHDAIFIAQDGFIKFPNSRLATIFGYSLEELTKKPFVEFVHPDDRELVAKSHHKRMQGEEVPSTDSFRAVNKSGHTLWVELGSVFLSWEGRPASLNFLRDITVEKKLESQLVHAQKMEAVGTLAGGIAHDFNNLLQAVQGYAEFLLLSKGEREPGYRELQEITRAARRGGELTRQLLTFSRKVESKLQPIDLNRIIEDVRSLLERTIPKMIKIEMHLTGNLHHVNADASQVEQVLMNLAVNARDAITDGGTLRIETKNVVLDEDDRRSQPELTPGKYVLLAVADTGQGMDKTILENIFDPFFTTKEVGKGTGLGLAMVYGIVKNHHGHIKCVSKPGEGTTFEIYLPAVEHPGRGAAIVTGTEVLRGGHETILLVDDDNSLRDLGQQILQAYGYTVLSAPDGDTALQVYQECRDRIDLVLLDLIMPGMGGDQCLQRILEVNYQAKIIIASGYSSNVETEKATECGAKAFIQKPYEVQQMLQMVREVLDG